MRTRILLLAAVTAATALQTTQAYAYIPTCASYDALAPDRVGQTGPDQVRAQFTIVNNCGAGRDFVIGLTLQTKRCAAFTECTWAQLQFSANESAGGGSYNSWQIVADCRDGKNRYRLLWEFYDDSFNFLGSGTSAEPELTCSDDPPPVNNPIPCEKPGTGELCRLITPPRSGRD